MWTYRQDNGALSDKTGQIVVYGYSGHGEGKNNPVAQELHDVGPIPRGMYVINAPVDTVTHGPYVLRLDPKPENEMFNRSGFLMHGDSIVHPGTASLGCIIAPKVNRMQVWNSGDHLLEVI